MTNFKAWLDKRTGPRKLPVRNWTPRPRPDHWHEADRVEWFAGQAMWLGRCRICGQNFRVGEVEAAGIEEDVERHLEAKRKRRT